MNPSMDLVLITGMSGSGKSVTSLAAMRLVENGGGSIEFCNPGGGGGGQSVAAPRSQPQPRAAVPSSAKAPALG